MKKIIVLLVSLFTLSNCTSNFESQSSALKNHCHKKHCKKKKVKNENYDCLKCSQCKTVKKDCEEWEKLECWKDYCKEWKWVKKCTKKETQCPKPHCSKQSCTPPDQIDAEITIEDAGTSSDLEEVSEDTSVLSDGNLFDNELLADSELTVADLEETEDVSVIGDLEEASSDMSSDQGVPVFHEDPPSTQVALAGGCNMSNNSTNFASIFFILFSLFLLKRNKIKTLVFCSLMLFSSNIFAQTVSTQNFKPTFSSTDILTTQSPSLSSGEISLLYQFENRPLKLIDSSTDEMLYKIIKQRHTLHLLGVVLVNKYLQLGIDIPFVLGQIKGDLGLLNFDHLEGGLADLRLLAKVKIFEYKFFSLGTSLDWTLPTSNVELVDEKWGSLTPLVLLGFHLKHIDLFINAGIILRKKDTVQGQDLQKHDFDNQLFVSLGAKIPLLDRKDFKLDLLLDSQLHSSLDTVIHEEVLVEVLGGLSASFKDIILTAGTGVGVTKGAGNPFPRLLASLSWIPSEKKCKPYILERETRIEITKETERIVKEEVPVFIPVFISIPSVFFETAKFELPEQAKEVLASIAEFLINNPDVSIRISGNADQRGSKEYNQRLSDTRATAVANFLKSLGVNNKVEIVGFGEDATLDKGEKAEQLQRNRRVDIHITDQENLLFPKEIK